MACLQLSPFSLSPHRIHSHGENLLIPPTKCDKAVSENFQLQNLYITQKEKNLYLCFSTNEVRCSNVLQRGLCSSQNVDYALAWCYTNVCHAQPIDFSQK